MKPYRMTTMAETAYREIEVTLIGPGLAEAGQRYVFSTKSRAEAFVHSLNFAYAQGVKEGLETAKIGIQYGSPESRALGPKA